VNSDEPIWQTPYKIPDALRDKVEQELQNMLDAGIIRFDPETKYNSPLIVIKKPDNNIRLVNNFVELNKRTATEKYQMSDPTEILSRVAGAKFCPKIDMNKYYWQLKLELKSQHLTGYWTPWGTCSYQRVPMGLCGAPITAQRAVDYLLRGARRYVSALTDDITVHSMTWENHLNHVRDVLVRLREACLTANKSK